MPKQTGIILDTAIKQFRSLVQLSEANGYAFQMKGDHCLKYPWERHENSEIARRALLLFIHSVALPDQNSLPLRRDSSPTYFDL